MGVPTTSQMRWDARLPGTASHHPRHRNCPRAMGEATERDFPMVGAIALRAERDTLAVGDTILVRATAFDGTGAPIEDLPLSFVNSDRRASLLHAVLAIIERAASSTVYARE